MRDIYGLDPTDPGLYTLVLDGTAFTTAACVEVIAAAAPPRGAPRAGRLTGQWASAGSAATATCGTPERKTIPQTIAPTTNTADEHQNAVV